MNRTDAPDGSLQYSSQRKSFGVNKLQPRNNTAVASAFTFSIDSTAIVRATDLVPNRQPQ